MSTIDLLAIECGFEVAWVAWMENPRDRKTDRLLAGPPVISCARFIARQPRRMWLGGSA